MSHCRASKCTTLKTKFCLAYFTFYAIISFLILINLEIISYNIQNNNYEIKIQLKSFLLTFEFINFIKIYIIGF